ncbi:MAG TPA: cytochrome C oxidase subunit IV family protein [Armatimonadota bacterium]|nr:cytochrome C oxidase subunit IV family protein [Armatimonadota bacterium]
MAEHSSMHGSQTAPEHHGMPTHVYRNVFWILMALLVVTLLAATQDWGPLNLPIAMAIAMAKVWFIVVYFMHLKISSQLTRVIAVGSLFWLSIMFVLTLADYASRGWLPQAGK